MKKFHLLVLFLAPFCSFSQFSDSFNDGLFKSRPAVERNVNWSGDEDCFIINEALQLQLNTEEATLPVYLSTSSRLSQNAYWECFVGMNFNPTASNYTNIFLTSDHNVLTNNPTGVFVRIGHTKKNVALVYAQSGKNNKVLIEGESKRMDRTSVAVKIKVTLDRNNIFRLYSQLEEESDYVLEGSCSFQEALTSTHFGIVCNYTKTRGKHFFFDDFLVRTLRDDEQEVAPEPKPDPVYDMPKKNDIVFSEVMAKPAGENAEYIELYNASDKDFNTKDLVIYYGDKPYAIPEATIAAKSYTVLCKTTAREQFDASVNVIGVPSFPILANTGKLLKLANTNDELISWIEYSEKWYADNDKKNNGGWSLECIDLSNLSNTSDNWTASAAEGGTPGRSNSVQRSNPDLTLPEIAGYETSGKEIIVTFSKPMEQTLLSNKNNYFIDDSGYRIESITLNDPQATILCLTLNKATTEGNLINITLNNMQDLSGNRLSDNTIGIGYGYAPKAEEVIINELLFNPPAGGEEYVELYNRSGQTFDLRHLGITSRKPSDGSFNKIYPLTAKAELFYPEEYLVISKDITLVQEHFNCPEDLFYLKPEGMPSIANTSGCVVIVNLNDTSIIDEFYYNEKMHHSSIKTKKGVALERVSPSIPASETSNWQSASAIAGYGTPGYLNSQGDETTGNNTPETEEMILISYPAASGEPYRIHYNLDASGYSCNLFLYDTSGRKIEQLVNNKLLGSQGTIEWSGRKSSGGSLPSGIYILFAELFNNDSGKRRNAKEVVVVGH